MTTARDVIATAVYLHDRNMLDNEESEAVADQIIAALLSAPDSVRLELAGMLNPWRPIETAPKDGTKILVYRPDEADGGFDAHAGVDYWNKGTWWHSRRDQQPTHWLPLPAPPSEDKPK